jgi:uncharacterized protein (UPF0262 family)
LSDASFDLFPDSLQISLHFAQLLFDVADTFLQLADRLLIQTPLVNVLADFFLIRPINYRDGCPSRLIIPSASHVN